MIIRNKSKILVVGSLVIFALSAVFVTLETVTYGAEMSKLETTGRELAKQKQELEETYVKTISLNELQEKSVELGFVKPTSLMFLSKNDSVAQIR